MVHLLYIDQTSIADLIKLKGKLNHLGFGTKDTAFCAASVQDYTAQLEELERLRDCSVLVVANHNQDIAMDMCQTLRLLAAMLWKRPIILTNTPNFASCVPAFYKEIILKRLNKIIISDLYVFDETDTAAILNNVAGEPVNYVLTAHERVLIRAAIKNYLAKLLCGRRTKTAKASS